MQNTQYYPGAINAGDCIRNAWDLVGNNYGLYFGISLLTVFIIACIPCVNFILYGPIWCGVYFCFLRAIRGEPVDFGMMFKGFEKFVPAMGIGLIIMIPEILAQILQWMGNLADIARITQQGRGSGDFFQSSSGLGTLETGMIIILVIVALGFTVLNIALKVSLMFALPLLIENDITAGEAMKLSFSAAWSNFGGLFVLGLLTGLLSLGGALVFCVGLFLVLPVVYCSWAFAYRQVFPDTKGNFQNMPPPPTSYQGGAYGTAQ